VRVAAQQVRAERLAVQVPPWPVPHLAALAALLPVARAGSLPGCSSFARCSGGRAAVRAEQRGAGTRLARAHLVALAAFFPVARAGSHLPGCSAFARCSSGRAAGADGAACGAGAPLACAASCGGGSVATGCGRWLPLPELLGPCPLLRWLRRWCGRAACGAGTAQAGAASCGDGGVPTGCARWLPCRVIIASRVAQVAAQLVRVGAFRFSGRRSGRLSSLL
jgi:hypothetical protein